jgi:hypothetical protein
LKNQKAYEPLPSPGFTLVETRAGTKDDRRMELPRLEPYETWAPGDDLLVLRRHLLVELLFDDFQVEARTLLHWRELECGLR